MVVVVTLAVVDAMRRFDGWYQSIVDLRFFCNVFLRLAKDRPNGKSFEFLEGDVRLHPFFFRSVLLFFVRLLTINFNHKQLAK